MWLEKKRVPFLDEWLPLDALRSGTRTRMIKNTVHSLYSFEYFICTFRYCSRTTSFSFGSMVLRHTYTQREKERERERKNTTSSFVSIYDYLIKWIATRERKNAKISLLSLLCPIVIMTLCACCRWSTEDGGEEKRIEKERSLTIYNRRSSVCMCTLVRLTTLTSIWFNDGASLH